MDRRDFLRFGGIAALSVGAAPGSAEAATQPVPSASGIFDVRAYGAKGDGTSDDTVAIAAAITAARRASGGIVWFPGGTYCTSTQILHGGITMQGIGWQSILKLLPGANVNLLESPRGVANYYGVCRDLTLDGNREANKTGDAISLWGATSYRLEGLRIKNAARHAIALSGDERRPTVAPWIVDTSIVNCTGTGISPSGFVCDCKIRSVDIGWCDKGVVLPNASFLSDVSIWQCNTGLYGYWAANAHLHMVRAERCKYSGFRFDGCRDVSVDQCRSYENNQAGTGAVGFQLVGTSAHRCERLSFTGCMAGLTASQHEKQLYGFSDGGSPYVDYILVQACTARGNVKGGYLLTGANDLAQANL